MIVSKKMNATAWKSKKTIDKHFYVLQVDDIKGKREENRIKKYLKSWENYGHGFDPKKKTISLIFSRPFCSEEEWKTWAREFPYPLIEVGKSGKKKPYKLGLAHQESKRKRIKNA